MRESRGSKANDLAQTCGDRSADPRCAQRPTGLARADTGADASRSKHSVRPDYWIFSRARDFIAPDIATVVVPVREYDVFFPQTVIVNRTYEFRKYGYAVNPGIAPTVVAAFAGRPVHTFEVRPVVLAGMVEARIPGAVAVRAQELNGRRGRRRLMSIIHRRGSKTRRGASVMWVMRAGSFRPPDTTCCSTRSGRNAYRRFAEWGQSG